MWVGCRCDAGGMWMGCCGDGAPGNPQDIDAMSLGRAGRPCRAWPAVGPAGPGRAGRAGPGQPGQAGGSAEQMLLESFGFV